MLSDAFSKAARRRLRCAMAVDLELSSLERSKAPDQSFCVPRRFFPLPAEEGADAILSMASCGRPQESVSLQVPGIPAISLLNRQPAA